jgi:hypothetical protein
MLATFDDTFESDLAQDATELVVALLLVATVALLATYAGVLDASAAEILPLVVEGSDGIFDWLIIY